MSSMAIGATVAFGPVNLMKNGYDISPLINGENFDLGRLKVAIKNKEFREPQIAKCQETRRMDTTAMGGLELRFSLPMDHAAYASVLQSCTLVVGKLFHAQILTSGQAGTRFLANLMIEMYGNCGCTGNAKTVFDGIYILNVFSWTVIIAAYIQNANTQTALVILWQMRVSAVRPNNVTFLIILCGFVEPKDIAPGKLIHALVIDGGFASDVVVANRTITMYAKCGNLDDAMIVFHTLCVQTVVSWNAMIAAYCQNGLEKEAFQLYSQMRLGKTRPDDLTFSTILSACSSLSALERGKLIHAQSFNDGLEPELAVGNSLVNMYGKCGSLTDACHIFNKLPKRSVISWNAILAGHAQDGCARKAFKVFWRMRLQGMEPNTITFLGLISSCTDTRYISVGKMIHSHVMINRFDPDGVLDVALISMYGKCKNLDHATKCFNKILTIDVVSYNAMIAACTQNGNNIEAIELFQKMRGEGITADEVTYITILGAYSCSTDLVEGKMIHAQVVRQKLEINDILVNALVNMYGKCRSVEDTLEIFGRLGMWNVTSTTIVITALSQNNYGHEAIKLFQSLMQNGLRPNKATFISVLDACANLALLVQGKQIHEMVTERDLESDVVVGSALVNMYGKCGSVDDALMVFKKMHQHNLLSWTALIVAFAQCGLCEDALQMARKMQQDGQFPDGITFVGILSACSNAGFMDIGYFNLVSMHLYGVTPRMEHFGCIVDILGESGVLDEAEDFLMSIPFNYTFELLASLLCACRVQNDTTRGERATAVFLELEISQGGPCIFLSKL